MNRSLYGIVREVYERGGFGEVLGATHGLDGVLDGQFMDLRAPSKATWERTAKTPAAALGSSRRKLAADDVPKVLDILSEHAVRYCFIIGGNDSADTGNVIAAETRTAGRSLTVINIPKTIDNDLVLTDHSPGYGSAARFVALATMGAGRDAESMGKASPITVVEVMGRDAGWLAASAALGKRDDRDAPHVVCVPEVPVDERRFLDLMENAYPAARLCGCYRSRERTRYQRRARQSAGALVRRRVRAPLLRGRGSASGRAGWDPTERADPIRKARHYPALAGGGRLAVRRGGGGDGRTGGGPLRTRGSLRPDGDPRQGGRQGILLLHRARTP